MRGDGQRRPCPFTRARELKCGRWWTDPLCLLGAKALLVLCEPSPLIGLAMSGVAGGTQTDGQTRSARAHLF